MTGPLPGGVAHPRRTKLCPCGRGRIFKKCCGSASPPRRPLGEKRLLVVGAGATYQECLTSGADPNHPLPLIKNFASELFNESQLLQEVIASYLTARGVPFNDAVLKAYAAGDGASFSSAEMDAGPLREFLRLEISDPINHNVERLFEHVWQTYGGRGEFWEALAWDAIFTCLFNAFITQFGMGPATDIRQLQVGQAVARCLVPGDRVVSLNYDIAFDLALQQAGRFIVYAPEVAPRGAITIYKPHGSFNYYADAQSGDAFFADPSQPRGSVALRDARGAVWSPASALIPPRLNKSYEQHPAARMILAGLGVFTPELVTFWGVGLTPSDVDLTDIYRAACHTAQRVEFINPDEGMARHAEAALGVPITHYRRWEDWVSLAAV
jgi:hypothetical protein